MVTVVAIVTAETVVTDRHQLQLLGAEDTVFHLMDNRFPPNGHPCPTLWRIVSYLMDNQTQPNVYQSLQK